jgi:hypothetical protein
VWSSIRRFLCACRRHLLAKETLLCALALSLGSIFVMARLPVLWRDYDGLSQITSPPGHLTILAQPHLYPFLSRLPVLFVSGLSGLAHPHSLELSIGRPVILNDLGLALLVAAQHLALVFALALLVVTSARRPLVRGLIVLVLLCNPILFVIAQFVSSEALASILAVLLVAIAIHLSRRQDLSRNSLIALGICLYCGIMTRHNAIVYVVLVPSIFLLGTIAHFRNRSERQVHFRKFLITAGIGLVAIIAANLTAFALCVVLREPYRSVAGRTAIYRFDLIDRMSVQEKDNFLRKLQAATADPITKEAIPAILAAKGYWGESMRVIKGLVRRRDKKLGGKKIDARADHYLNEICWLYYQTAPPVVLDDIRVAIVQSLIRTTPSEIIQFFYQNARDSLALYRSKPDLRKKTAHLASCSADAESRIQRAKETWWLRGFDRIPCGMTLGIILTLAIVLRSLGRLEGNTLCLLLALGVVNVLMIVVTLSITPYLARFVLPSCVINAGALAILLGGLDSLFPRLPSHARST